MTIIYNVNAYAKDFRLIVAREYDGKFWFWGAYNDLHEVENVLHEYDNAKVWWQEEVTLMFR